MKHSSNLQAVIYRSYLTSALVPILMIELVLLMLYFGTNSYISSQNQTTLLTEVAQHLQEVTQREAAKIDTQLNEVSRYAAIMQQAHQDFFANLATGRCLLPDNAANYRFHANGVFYKHVNTGGSGLYYSANTELQAAQFHKARCSEKLDTFMRSVVNISPVISQAYLNTWDNMIRIYPYIDNIPDQFGPTLDVTKYNFYYLADQQHNPTRGPVWTGEYLDPAGQGWMISNIIPIYRGNFLEGVSGLDVTIKIFIDQVLNLQLHWDAQTFMASGDGRILAALPKTSKLLNLPELQEHADTQSSEILDPSAANNLLSPAQFPALQQLREIFLKQQPTGEIDINGTAYLTSQEIIPQTGWRLFTLVDKSLIFKKIYSLEELTYQLGIFAIISMLFFYALFFWYLRRKSIRLATLIATPIKKLSDATCDLGDHMATTPLHDVGLEEIDTLKRNFNAMIKALNAKTRQLIELEIREKLNQREAELLETLALTDRLTGLANRHKLDEILDHEFARAIRFENQVGVIIMDIDHFKQINDTYGHQTGDQFLKEIAGILKEHTRKTDTIGRWGGEEFMIICPKTNPEGLFEVAEHLRLAIANYTFSEVGKRTASFGTTLSTTSDNIDTIIQRADTALYRAKHLGRNRTETD